MAIEVAHATPDHQVVITIEVDLATTVAGAIYQSGILCQFPEIDLAVNAVGVFGKRVALEARLRPGDRIEIYRALQTGPRKAHKRRALRVRADGR